MSSGKQKLRKGGKVRKFYSVETIVNFFADGFSGELRIQIIEPDGKKKRIFGDVVDVLALGTTPDSVYLKVHSDTVKRKDKQTGESFLVAGNSTIVVPLSSVVQVFTIEREEVKRKELIAEEIDEKESRNGESEKDGEEAVTTPEHDDDDDEGEDYDDDDDDG